MTRCDHVFSTDGRTIERWCTLPHRHGNAAAPGNVIHAPEVGTPAWREGDEEDFVLRAGRLEPA